MARTWSMRFNLDDFNASYAALDDDSDKAQFLTGFSRGLNAGSLKDGASEALSCGFSLGHEMRREAEEFRAQAAIHGAKGKGTHGDTRRGKGEGSLVDGDGEPHTQTTNHKPQSSTHQPPASTHPGLDQEGAVPRLEHTLPGGTPHRALPKKRTTTAKEPKPKLEAILGPKGLPDEVAYWKLVGIFGAAKNPAPTQTAQAFVEAMLKVPAHSILAKAQNLRDSLSGPQYMPQLQKWLDGQGYLNPDASMGSGKPMSDVTSDYVKDLEAAEVPHAC